MKLVYLSAHYPPNFQQFAVELSRQGVAVLGITDQLFSFLPDSLKQALQDHRQVHNLHDTRAVLSAIEDMARFHGPPDKVESHIETWLETEASVREYFGLEGPGFEQTALFKHKSRMKECFKAHQIPVAEGLILHQGDQNAALEFARSHGFPLVLKPDCGVGAEGAIKIESERSLVHHVSRMSSSAFLEVYLDGRIESFDGLTDQAGNIVYCTSHIYSAGVREIVSQRLDFTIASRVTIPPDLWDLGKRIVSAFQVREKFFHLEFFRLGNGQLVALEANIRPPGGLILDMMNWASDINLYQQWASVVAWNRFTDIGESKYHVAHISRRAGRPYLYSSEQLWRRFPQELLRIERLPKAAANAMGEFAIFARSESMTRIAEIVQAVHRLAE